MEQQLLSYLLVTHKTEFRTYESWATKQNSLQQECFQHVHQTDQGCFKPHNRRDQNQWNRRSELRKTMVSNCLWSLNRGHCAGNQEVRVEITYVRTISLQNCSSHHHRKRVHKTQSHLRFETLHSSVSKKSLTISRFLHWLRYRAEWLLATRKWWAKTLL